MRVAWVETVCARWPSTYTFADPCAGPTVVIQPSVRTPAEKVALAPAAVE